ncbi:MAG TPA: DinB family protein [Thermoanaerobaculia bacterium]|nr:DinB family protein [Thermoanaerobaculia bacterium]
MTSVFSNRAGRTASEAQAYVRAVTGLVGERDPLAVLAATPGELERRVTATPVERLRVAEAPGKWSALEALRHLADTEIVYGWRFRLVLAEEKPTLTGFDQDRWAARLRYSETPPDHAIASFRINRKGNLWLLRGAGPADLARVGMHSERGEESLERLVLMAAGHDLLHLRQIDRILAAAGGS